MKHFSKLDYFWNSSLFQPIPSWMKSDMDRKKKKKKKKKEKKKEKETWNSSLGNSSSICTKLEFPKLEFLVKNLGTQVSETRVPLFFLLKKKI